MIEKILNGPYTKIKLLHVKLTFSKDMEDIGNFRFGKVLHLLQVITRIIYIRFKHRPTVLYYPPAGPDKIPMYRDFIILIFTRWMFSKTIFHFHAGGISNIYDQLNCVSQLLFRLAYYQPDGSILLSSLNPQDGQQLKSKREFIIPYGIEDNFPQFSSGRKRGKGSLLFVSVLKESKGLMVFLKALKRLREQNILFDAKIMGQFESSAFENRVLDFVNENNLGAHVTFTGVLTGNEKWTYFSNANIFCYPTFFESETFGLVVLEAMQFELPTIVTSWRGVPSLVEDRKTGVIVPIKNDERLAIELKALINNSNLATQMGKKGRELFSKYYSLKKFHERIEQALVDVAEPDRKIESN